MVKKKLEKDISNKVVLVMLIAAIVVSIASLGVYIQALEAAEPEIYVNTLGRVSLTTMDPPVEPVSKTSLGGGKVGLGIIEPKK